MRFPELLSSGFIEDWANRTKPQCCTRFPELLSSGFIEETVVSNMKFKSEFPELLSSGFIEDRPPSSSFR